MEWKLYPINEPDTSFLFSDTSDESRKRLRKRRRRDARARRKERFIVRRGEDARGEEHVSSFITRFQRAPSHTA